MDSHQQESFAQSEQAERTAKIRALNDRLRIERMGGQLCVTHGICALGERVALLQESSWRGPQNHPASKSAASSMEIVGTTKLLSKYRFRCSQLVSATKMQLWQAAPASARSSVWFHGLCSEQIGSLEHSESLSSAAPMIVPRRGSTARRPPRVPCEPAVAV